VWLCTAIRFVLAFLPAEASAETDFGLVRKSVRWMLDMPGRAVVVGKYL
jgi:hypothetical protein